MANTKTIFIDADAFIALNFYNHPNYKKAIHISKKIDELHLEVFTCTYVLLEVATVINMYFEAKRGPELAQQIIDNPSINIIEGDMFLEDGIKKMSNQTSKNTSLNDCVYFAIVEKLQINTVFSFDKHWRKNGYSLMEI